MSFKHNARAEAIARISKQAAINNGVDPEQVDTTIDDALESKGYVPEDDPTDAINPEVQADTDLDIQDIDDGDTKEEFEEDLESGSGADDDIETEVVKPTEGEDAQQAQSEGQASTVEDDRMAKIEAQLEQMRQENARLIAEREQPSAQQQQEEVEQVDLGELRSRIANAAADADVEAMTAAQAEYDAALTNQITQQVTKTVTEQVQKTTFETQVNNAAKMFGEEYADVDGDPVLGELAVSRFSQKVQSGVDPMTAARQVGDDLRAYKSGLTGGSDARKGVDAGRKAAEEQLENRRAQKRQSVVDVPSATGRQEAPKPVPEPTSQDHIQKMKARRGQLRAVA